MCLRHRYRCRTTTSGLLFILFSFVPRWPVFSRSGAMHVCMCESLSFSLMYYVRTYDHRLFKFYFRFVRITMIVLIALVNRRMFFLYRNDTYSLTRHIRTCTGAYIIALRCWCQVSFGIPYSIHPFQANPIFRFKLAYKTWYPINDGCAPDELYWACNSRSNSTNKKRRILSIIMIPRDAVGCVQTTAYYYYLRTKVCFVLVHELSLGV